MHRNPVKRGLVMKRKTGNGAASITTSHTDPTQTNRFQRSTPSKFCTQSGAAETQAFRNHAEPTFCPSKLHTNPPFRHPHWRSFRPRTHRQRVSFTIGKTEEIPKMSATNKTESFLERWWQWLVILFGIAMVIIFLTYNPVN